MFYCYSESLHFVNLYLIVLLFPILGSVQFNNYDQSNHYNLATSLIAARENHLCDANYQSFVGCLFLGGAVQRGVKR